LVEDKSVTTLVEEAGENIVCGALQDDIDMRHDQILAPNACSISAFAICSAVTSLI
jgi:hypothetical protein